MSVFLGVLITIAILSAGYVGYKCYYKKNNNNPVLNFNEGSESDYDPLI